jgi:hypothetical protein
MAASRKRRRRHAPAHARETSAAVAAMKAHCGTASLAAAAWSSEDSAAELHLQQQRRLAMPRQERHLWRCERLPP